LVFALGPPSPGKSALQGTFLRADLDFCNSDAIQPAVTPAGVVVQRPIVVGHPTSFGENMIFPSEDIIDNI